MSAGGAVMPLAFDWPRIEADARAEAQRELAAIEATPLEIGQHVCWSEMPIRGVATDGLSEVHRVAQTGDKPQTYCGERIPEAVRRFTLTPRLVFSMRPCRWCAEAFAQFTRGAA